MALLAGRLMLWALPDFYAMINYEQGPGGGTVLSVEKQLRADAAWALTAAASWCFAYFLGGTAAGRTVRQTPGFNGALVAVCGALFGVINAISAIGPDNLLDNSDGGPVFIGLIALSVFFPITVLAAYLGGKVGGKLRPDAVGEGR